MALARLKFLDKAEEDLIHEQSLRCLERIGVMVKSPSVLKMLGGAGASIDEKRGVAKIPESMVLEALKMAPKMLVLGARDPKNEKVVPVETFPLLATTGLAIHTRDIDSGQTRPTTNQDLANFSRMADAMDAVDICWTTVTASDVPQEALAVESLWTVLQNNTKHIHVVPATDGVESARRQVELAALVAGGPEQLKKKPLFSVISCSIAPLAFAGPEIEAQAEFAKHGIPVVSMSMSLGGLSSPITMAGTLENINAENLASLVITQTSSPGAPFIYSTESAPMDMKTGVMDYNSYWLPVLSAGAAQFAIRYGLPNLVASWGFETVDPGMQSAFGEGFGTALGTFSGSDMMSGCGSLDHAKGAALEQVVMDSYLWEDIRGYMKKYTVSKEKIALDVIEQVGHGNTFLTNPHTARNFKAETPFRDQRKKLWQATLSTRMADEAREEARKILKEHEVPSLDMDVLRRGSEIVKEYEKKLLA
jgi:trimethylamine--corrinoid protein Co-methyltransferase